MAPEPTGTTTPTYEPFSPYYLHPSEGTGTLISPVSLRVDNYEEWSRTIRNNLNAKNKMGFLDGTITAPDKKHPDYAQWSIVNSMLVAWIVNTLDKEVRSGIQYPDNGVKELWDELRVQYSMGNGPRILELKSRIADCKQRSRSVVTYYGELRRLQADLAAIEPRPVCTCAAAAATAKMRENEVLHQFCMGLDPTKYGNVVSNLLMMDPLPSLHSAYAKVIAEERKQAMSENPPSSRPDAVGFAANGSSASRSSRGTTGDESRNCSHCGKHGHDRDNCFDIIGIPDWYKEKYPARGGRSGGGRSNNNRGRARGSVSASGSRNLAAHATSDSGQAQPSHAIPDRSQFPYFTDGQWQQLVTAIKSMPTGVPPEKLSGMCSSDDWIIDTGASNHMSGPHFEEPDWSGDTI